MSRHLQREIEGLKKKILALGAMIETAVRDSVISIEKRDAVLAQQVIDNDAKIDQTEVDIEEDCLKILALHQPVAIDLRFIIAMLKINNDLERIGDMAVNIAERSKFLSTLPPVKIAFDFTLMADKTKTMVKNSLDAMVNMDCNLANKVRTGDNEIDAINRQMYEQTKKAMREHPDRIDTLVHLLGVSRSLERMADHATNIAEDVIYMVEGAIIRHQDKE